MREGRRDEEVTLLLKEAAYRLRWARKYDPTEDPRILCENAHDCIEVCLNTLLVAAGERHWSTHDLSNLANKVTRTALRPSEELTQRIKELPLYTGGGRYEYRKTGDQEPIPKTEYDAVLEVAEEIFRHTTDRVRQSTRGEE